MSHVLMVGYNESYLSAIEASVAPRCIVVLEEPDVIRRRELDQRVPNMACVAALLPAAYHESEDILDVGMSAHETWQFNAVVPALEYAVPGAAALAARLQLPGATVTAAETLRDKLLLRATAAQAGIRGPKWREVWGPQDIYDFAEEGPVIVKPANRWASIGVHRLDHASMPEVVSAWESMISIPEGDTAPNRSLQRRYMAEELLRGPEYSVEALIRNGEIIFDNVTEKIVVAGRYPVELAHVVPAPLEGQIKATFSASMCALVEAIQFDTGILHAEWILTADGPALIECAGRCPGDSIVDLIDLAYGTSLRLDLLELLAGGRPALPMQPKQASAIRFLKAEMGRVTGTTGAEEMASLPGVHEVRITATPGTESKVWKSSWDRAGFVIVTAEDAGRARALADIAARGIQIGTT